MGPIWTTVDHTGLFPSLFQKFFNPFCHSLQMNRIERRSQIQDQLHGIPGTTVNRPGALLPDYNFCSQQEQLASFATRRKITT
jgi:hypothetical protein